MSGPPSGIAPILDVEPGTTSLCGRCATLIRYHPQDYAWRHAIAGPGMDHAPEPPINGIYRQAADAAAEITESEQRALWGDR